MSSITLTRWKKAGLIGLYACFAITGGTFFWYVKFILSGDLVDNFYFLLVISTLLMAEFALLMPPIGDYENPIYIVLIANLWPTVTVVGWGTGITVLGQIVTGTFEWLKTGRPSHSEFGEYLDFFGARLGENTTYLGWNRIANSINHFSMLGGEIITIFISAILFVCFFEMTEWGKRKPAR